jgi:3-hydroxy acid dehydrogenase / malonic semialdehyde reductase
LILVARNEEKLLAAKKSIQESADIDVKKFAVDLQDMDAIEKFYGEVSSLDIDIVINNAGLALGKASFEDYDFKDFEGMIDTNIKGFLKVAQLAMPHLKKHKGHIVNLSSIAGVEAYEGGSVYCASKAFVKMISRNLRIDLAGTGVRVTDIAPGAVETDFSNTRFKGDTAVAESVYKGYAPLQPEDIADCIAFAVSRPVHVNIDYMLVMPTAQASATRLVKN